MRAVRWWVGLKDYVLWHLTGPLVTELSSASGTGLLDIGSRTWNPAALELAGVSVDCLPPVLDTTATLSLSAQAGAPGRAAGRDNGRAGRGRRATREPRRRSHRARGSGLVARHQRGGAHGRTEPRTDPDGTLFCYALTDSAWVVGGAVSNGGIVVRWAGSALAPDLTATPVGPTVDEQVLELAAAVAAGCDGLMMLPYLLSERAPLWDPDLPGAYLGLRRHHTRAHLVRAAVEGVCLQLSAVVDRLDQIEPVTSVRATGGVFRSPLWRDVMAAMLDRPLTIATDAGGSALGAAALGLYAVGLSPRLEDAPALLLPVPSADANEIHPDPSLVAAYADTRNAVAELIHALGAVAYLFRAPRSLHRTTNG